MQSYMIKDLFTEMTRFRDQIKYELIDFIPMVDLASWANPEKVFNTFVGLAAQKIENVDDFSSIQIILDHIRLEYANAIPEINDYLLNWLAQMVQHPDVKPNLAILL